MDTIINYLENMFLSLPQTDEVQRAKRELRDMMEDKYQELREEGKTDNEAVGIVISEFGNLKELAKELGIENEVNGSDKAQENASVMTISEKEARQYIEVSKKQISWNSLAVALCIICVVPLIVVGGLTDTWGYPEYIVDRLCVAVGLSSLFVMIAIAVGIFIYQGTRVQKFEYLNTEAFQLELGLERRLVSELEMHQSSQTLCTVIGVILCILSVLPLIVLAVITPNEDIGAIIGVGILLCMVAAGVFLMIFGGRNTHALKVLLQQGEYSRDEKERNKSSLAKKINAIYWPIVTCIYFIWSFVTFDWHISWIVWPIAAVLDSVIVAIVKAFEK